MRMWNVDPKRMCRAHLLGEHLELHMFLGAILKGHSMDGYIQYGLLEPYHLWTRHDELVEEIERRGFRHITPLKVVTLPDLRLGYIDIRSNEIVLSKRCSNCRFLTDEGRK